MTLSRTALLLVGCAAVLAACSKPAGNTQTTTASGQTAANAQPAAPPAATSGPDTSIGEADLPHPRAGMWQVTTTMNGVHEHTSTHCYKGEAFEMRDKRVPGCTAWQFKRTFLGAYVVDAACAAHGMTSQYHAQVQGDFLGGHYTYDGKAHIQVGERAMDFASHVDAHWLGPC